MTIDDAQAKLRQALDSLAAVNVPEDLRLVAFERLLDAVGLTESARPHPHADRGVHQREQMASSSSESEDGSRTNEPVLGRVASKLDVAEDPLSRVYEDDGTALRLIIRRAMLPEPSRKAASMRDVALLVVAGRQAAGQEDWTPLSVVREECAELGVLDPSNFAKEIGKLGWKYRGAGGAREVRATRHHLDDAAELIKRISGGD